LKRNKFASLVKNKIKKIGIKKMGFYDQRKKERGF